MIDEKVDSDTKEVLNKMDVLTNFMAGIKKNELKKENQGLKSEIKIVYWVIGIAMAIIALMNDLKLSRRFK